MSGFIQQLNKSIFWDVDFNRLDEAQSKRLIIERVVRYGSLNELLLIKKHYGLKEIRTTLTNLNYIEPKSLNFAAMLYNIPKSNFKCYTRKQSASQPWNY